MRLSAVFQALRAVKIAEEQERKQSEFDALQAQPLKYTIIQDLINSAAAGVVIDITLADGTKMVMRKEDAYDRARLDAAINREFVGGF
jgi:uncharacterized protein (UPF0303 family)